MNPITIEKLDRGFGDTPVLEQLDFTIEPGTITGLLGINGSGKTTLIHCILGLLKPNAGTCHLFGEASWDASVTVRHRTGFVAQTFDNFEWMTVRQLASYTGAFYDNWDESFVDKLIRQFDLDADARVSSLSVGLKQRVAIVLALGHHPELLVLDEPVASLDPVGRREFVELMLDLHLSEGKTILFSTHITSDVERLAASVALLKGGKIDLHANLEDVKQNWKRLHLHGKGVAEIVAGLTSAVSSQVHEHSARVTVSSLSEADSAHLATLPDVTIDVESLNLEEVFLELGR